MQLSLFSDYSMRTLLFLAMRPEQSATIRQIASAYGISRTHLMKVANEMVRRGYVQSLRGRSGGLKLAVAPEEINVGEVVRQSEQQIPLIECFDAERNACRLSPACHFKAALREAEARFYDSLSSYTLADLVRTAPARKVLKQAVAAGMAA